MLCIIFFDIFEDIQEEYLHADCKLYCPGSAMQLDAYVPALNLAFEYQGEQHFTDLYIFGQQVNQAARDDEKKELCIQVTFRMFRERNHVIISERNL